MFPRSNPWSTPAHRAARFGGLSLLLFLGFGAAPARAELMHDVAQAKKQLARLPFSDVAAPRLMERGEQRPLALPREALSAERCTTLVLLSHERVSFTLHLPPAAGGAPEPPIGSVAGLIELTRCGAARGALGGAVIEMRSPRGVLERVVAASAKRPRRVRSRLPARQTGPVIEPSSIGPRATRASLPERFATLRRQAELRGDASLFQRSLMTDATGQARVDLDLLPGCFRVDLLGPPDPPGAGVSFDLDLELRRLPDGALVAADHSEALDAHVEFCTSTPGEVRLGALGGMPRAPVITLITRWPLPPLPDHFSTLTKNQLALRWLRQRTPPPADSGRQREWLGVVGHTTLALPTRAGACYQVVVAAHAGAPESLALEVSQGRARVENQSDERGAATDVTWCAPRNGQARLRVQAQGAGLVWRAVAYQVSSPPVGEPAPDTRAPGAKKPDAGAPEVERRAP
ncbi:MAG: hypothetical protein KIT72_13635 [Polyangiaceae bacterium]|nr:hypothetical protein [Polyangiaceae bacterium]MCW5791453.1 hypothetical protein [Polyangiaceae bacterium]